MPTILAIETSTELASAALLHGDSMLARSSCGVQTHSQTLLPMVQELLAEAGLSLAQCDAIAFGAGPGSFTGVRTACGVTQGLAYGVDLPVIPVSTLLALAHDCRQRTGANEVIAVLDARMEEIYWAQYRFDSNEGWQTLVQPRLALPSDLPPPESAETAFWGNGFAANPAAFIASGLSVLPQPILPHAASVASLALVEFQAGRTVRASDAQPVYLRNKVALTTAERLERHGRQGGAA